MGFLKRKSLKVGLLRLNLSKSGMGISLGVKGLRIGSGPRGNYIFVGKNKYVFQKTKRIENKVQTEEVIQPNIDERKKKKGINFIKLQSEEIFELDDSSAEELIDEIRSKRKRPAYWKLIGILLFILLLVLVTLDIKIWIIIISLIISGVLVLFVSYRDKMEKTVVLFYELDDETEHMYQGLYTAFNELSHCSKAWRIMSEGDVTTLYKWKTTAGASKLVERIPINTKPGLPKYFSSNIEVPVINASETQFYFFPDKLFLFKGKQVAIISYDNFAIEIGKTRFIEESVPPDAEIVDYTWKYVNKNGGPDRRFKDNYRIAIVLYTEMHISNHDGLNLVFQFSKSDTGEAFVQAVREIQSSSLIEQE